MLRIVVVRYFFCCCVFLISNGSWVWVWVCCYSRFIIIYISFHLHHILTCCLLRLRSTISIPYVNSSIWLCFLCICYCSHTCIVFVRAFIFRSTDVVHCCCCCHWCWFVIFIFCFCLCRFELNISAAKQFSSISDSCRCGLKNIITPILLDVGNHYWWSIWFVAFQFFSMIWFLINKIRSKFCEFFSNHFFWPKRIGFFLNKIFHSCSFFGG